jgi:FlaA1/EpsC-like NDP-sugar epimerase
MVRTRLTRVARGLQGHRRALALAIYAAITAAAYGLAFLFRFEFAMPRAMTRLYLLTVVPLIGIRMAIFVALRLTRERWRYASARDATRLAIGCLVGSVLFYLLSKFVAPDSLRVPLSVIVMEGILTCGMTAAVWLTYRLSFEHIRHSGNGDRIRMLIIGAGDAGNLLAREMLRTGTSYLPVAFVDDDPNMWGRMVQGREVVGSTADLKAIARKLAAQQVIIAVPSAGPADFRRIVAACDETGLPYKVLPGISEVISGYVSLSQLRHVEIEDLLGREPIELELPELAEDMRGRSVLITGAAGSIGSELARQVALHKPGRLLLMDQAETDLYYIELDLRGRHPDLQIVPLVGDITEAVGVERVFRLYDPERVFHAAAYKHVPMMECNAREAVRNNVIGTWRVAEAAGRFGSEKFVLVSTDKAVRPTNVMGATKRLAELTVLELQARYPATSYGAVRFGNVLGSNGSVIPIFKRQLQDGKPLTVTHPETTRYFMTIPEAVQLILQASLLDEFRGHIVMLEMGDPVRITDLALNLLRLSGVNGGRDRLVYTGLRPGEKLHEELCAPDEESQPTPVPKIRVLSTYARPDLSVVEKIKQWDLALQNSGDDALLGGLFDLFPLLNRDVLKVTPVAAERPRQAILKISN